LRSQSPAADASVTLPHRQLTPERSKADHEFEKNFERMLEDYKVQREVYLDDVAALEHAREDWEEDAEASHIARGGSATTWRAEAARAGDHFDLRPWKEAVERMRKFETLEAEVMKATEAREAKLSMSRPFLSPSLGPTLWD
jgi:hypothetical protein